MHRNLDDLARRAEPEIGPTTFDELSIYFTCMECTRLAGTLYSRMRIAFVSSFYLQILGLCLLSGPDRFFTDVDTVIAKGNQLL